MKLHLIVLLFLFGILNSCTPISDPVAPVSTQNSNSYYLGDFNLKSYSNSNVNYTSYITQGDKISVVKKDNKSVNIVLYFQNDDPQTTTDEGFSVTKINDTKYELKFTYSNGKALCVVENKKITYEVKLDDGQFQKVIGFR